MTSPGRTLFRSTGSTTTSSPSTRNGRIDSPWKYSVRCFDETLSCSSFAIRRGPSASGWPTVMRLFTAKDQLLQLPKALHSRRLPRRPRVPLSRARSRARGGRVGAVLPFDQVEPQKLVNERGHLFR